MTNIPFPMLTMPGQQPMVSGGRLINCYPEPLSQTAGLPNAYWRVPGLSVFGTTPSGSYRGGVYVQGVYYAIFGTTVYTFTSAGGAGTALTGSVPGTGFCYCSVNQASTPDVVFVSPGIGAFWSAYGSSSVGAYPDINVNSPGTPNCVTYMQGYFIFTYGNWQTIVTGPNNTAINPLNFATANSKPDTLFRPIPFGGQLLLCGSHSIPVFGGSDNQNRSPFFF